MRLEGALLSGEAHDSASLLHLRRELAKSISRMRVQSGPKDARTLLIGEEAGAAQFQFTGGRPDSSERLNRPLRTFLGYLSQELKGDMQPLRPHEAHSGQRARVGHIRSQPLPDVAGNLDGDEEPHGFLRYPPPFLSG